MLNEENKEVCCSRDKVSKYQSHNKRDMIFIEPSNDNFCENRFFHTHIMFLLSLSIALISVSMSTFLCKFLIVYVVVI